MSHKNIFGFEVKTRDDIVEEVKNRLSASGSLITNWNPGGVARTITEAFAQGLADLYTLLFGSSDGSRKGVVHQGFLPYSSGKWLDAKVAELDLVRRPAVRTVGEVIITREPHVDRVVIPDGTIVQTLPGKDGEVLRYFVIGRFIHDGELSRRVPVRAEFPGWRYNVGANMITKMAQHIHGVASVTNDAAWITTLGSDEESDEALRARYLRTWHELSRGGTDGAYIAWATSPEVGGYDAVVDSEHPRGQGTVDVYLSSPTGPADAAMLAAAREYIEARKPNIANVHVYPSNPVEIDISVRLVLPEFDGDEALVMSEANARLAAFFSDNPSLSIRRLRIGEGLARSRISFSLSDIPKVRNVAVLLPEEDVAIGRFEQLVPGNITVQVVREGGFGQ